MTTIENYRGLIPAIACPFTPNYDIDEAALRKKMDDWRKTLMAVRVKRVWPGLDDKILTSWNGLMIASLARTSALLNEPRYREAAVKAVLSAGLRTADIWSEGNKKVGTRQMGDAVVAALS